MKEIELLPRQDPSGHFSCFMNGCDGKFVKRRNRKTGDIFYGCSRYPNCTATRSARDVEDQFTACVIGEFDPEEPHLRWDQ